MANTLKNYEKNMQPWKKLYAPWMLMNYPLTTY